MINTRKKLFVQVVVLVFTLVFFGSLGYHLIDNLSWFESLYMTLITISTVGYGETFPLSNAGRLWSLLLIVVGVTMIGVLIGRFAELLTDIKSFRRHRMLQKIKDMKNISLFADTEEWGGSFVNRLFNPDIHLLSLTVMKKSLKN